MLRRVVIRVVIIATLMMLLLTGVASAADSRGEVVFRDAMYGAGIGLLLGTSIWLIDTDNDLLTSLGIGVTAGAVGGTIYGLTVDSRSLVEIDKDDVRFAVPSPSIQKRDDAMVYSVPLLKAEW